MKQNIKMRVTPEQSRKVQEICFNNGVYWNLLLEEWDIRQTTSEFLYIEDVITHSFSESPYLDDDFKEENDFFNEQELEEIDADLFIRTNGTCEDTTLSDDNIDFADIKIKVDDKQKTAIVNILNSMCLNYLVIGDYIYTDEDVIVKNIDNLEINEIDANCFIKKYANKDYQGTEAELLLSKVIDFKDKEYIKLEKKVFNLKKQLEKYVIKIANQKEEITRLLSQKEDLQNRLNIANRTVGMSIDNDIELIRLIEEKDAIIKYLESKLYN